MTEAPLKLTQAELIKAVASLLVDAQGSARCEIPADHELTISHDSRACRAGDVYLAYPGAKTDVRPFIRRALDAGVSAVVTEKELATSIEGEERERLILVTHARAAWAHIASAACKHPQNDLDITAVTGTNGKSSTAWLLRSLLAQLGQRCAMVGTLGLFVDEEVYDTPHTTPDPPQLYRFLAEVRERGIRHVVMEASSHAMDQHKLAPMKFQRACWTSFSRDHLDHHETMEAYFAAKARVLAHVADRGLSLIHEDVLNNAWFPPTLGSACTPYGPHSEDARIVSTQQSTTQRGHSTVALTVAGQPISLETPFTATHDHENLLAACYLARDITGAALESTGIAVPSVPGRSEVIRPRRARPERPAPLVYVDYAHTPDALAATLRAARAHTPGRLWVVFGCGGDRDRGKRPQMAQAADRLADLIILTNDNPRSESAERIAEECMRGFDSPDPQRVRVCLERGTAIASALTQASAGDTVVVAGKGHERGQRKGDCTYPFSDREFCQRVLDQEAHMAQEPSWSKWIEALAGAGAKLSDADHEVLASLPVAQGCDWSTDSRNIGSDQCFVPIVGARFDGHDFIATAIERGVKVYVYDPKRHTPAAQVGVCAIAVDDTLSAYHALAQAWRTCLDATVFALTGSVGKTTTRSMLSHILQAHGSVHESFANENNEIGVAKTILSAPADARWLNLEMGARKLHDIAPLAAIAQPDVAACLNAKNAHLEIFGSRENLLATKLEIYGPSPTDKALIAPADDDAILARAASLSARVLSFGSNDRAHVQLVSSHWAADALVCTYRCALGHEDRTESRHEVRYRAAHQCYGINGAAAAAMALASGLDAAQVFAQLESFEAPDGRFRTQRIGSKVFIDDTYNANPASMRSGLETLFSAYPKRPRLIAVGDMLELGSESEDAHRDIGRHLCALATTDAATTRVACVGASARLIAESLVQAGFDEGQLHRFENVGELIASGLLSMKGIEVVYAKASRAIGLDQFMRQVEAGARPEPEYPDASPLSEG